MWQAVGPVRVERMVNCVRMAQRALTVFSTVSLAILRKPVDDVLDGILAISHLSSLARRGGALALLQSDFHSGNLVTVVTIGRQKVGRGSVAGFWKGEQISGPVFI
jgi:hypothetical protein